MADMIIEPIEPYALSKKVQVKTLFSRIGVIGCGIEAQGIARIASWYGMEVVLVAKDQEKLESAINGISKELDKRIQSWGLTPSEKRAIMGRIQGSLECSSVAGCDFVIEAIPANPETGFRDLNERKRIFREVEKVVSEDAIIATNATTIVITELASELKKRDRTVSLHFFVSSPEAKIIEVVKGLYTSDTVYERVCKFVELINRDVIPVMESAGIVSMRLYVALLNEACHTLMEGVASMSDIDKTMEIGLGMRFGPFRSADFIGLEKVVIWMENLYEEFGQQKYKPAPLLKRLVRAKRLGVHTKAGFYKYDDEGNIIAEDFLSGKIG
ncbi:MAG: 3-hydroxyacyl-CoA dehydrogenase family protein [Chlorobi bacterium]|nr:3-hydroxyacyl-CoA dehydrogenase family protein [Chlorobiota bacterium]